MPVLNPINWSALTSGQSVAFNPLADQLVFDAGTITAASITGLGYTDPTASPFTLTVDGKTVTFQAALASLTGDNVSFASGGLFLVGDGLSVTAGDASANNLAGGTGNDYLVGLVGNDTLNGGSGADVAAYRGALAGYGFSLAGGNLVVTDIDAGNGDDGIDTLRAVERVRFGDALVVVVPGSEFQVNSTTANDQSQSSVAGLADGGLVVVWTSSLQDGSGTGVYAQRYDAAGSALGAEFRVNSTTANDQSQPAVAALGGGGFVVAWTSNGQDGSGESVHAQRYGADGLAQGAEFRVNTYTTNNQSSPSIAALTGGGFVVAWMSNGQDGGGNGVYAQRYDAAGVAQGTEFRVTTTTAPTQEQPSVSALTNGGFSVAWASNGQDGGSGYGVMQRRYDANGTGQGQELFINTFTAGNQWQPAVASLPGGGFVLAWSSEGQDGSGYGVYARRMTASSGFLGAEFRVNETTANGQSQPVLAALADGGFIVAWVSESQDGNLGGVYARRYDSVAVAQGAEFLVNTYTLGNERDPSVTALADGGFAVAWTSDGQDGSGNGVHAQRYDALGQRVGASLIGDGGANVLRWTGSDGVAWMEGGGGNDTLIGGTGADEAVFRGASSGYAISRTGGSVVVTDIDTVNGDEGADRLIDIEAVQFGDGRVTVGAALPEFRVNTFTFNGQSDPSVAGLVGGGFVVAWASAGQDGSSFGVYAQRYDADALAQGGEFRVSTFVTGAQYEPSVTALNGGGFVVAWRSDSQDGSVDGVYAQRYDAAGNAQGTEFRVNTFIPDSQSQPSVAALSAGGYVVAWSSLAQDGSSFGVYAQRFDAAGVAQGAEFRVNAFTTGGQWQPSVTALSGGGFVVAWTSDNINGTGQDGSGSGVYAQRYDATGVAQGGEFQVNTFTTASQYEPSVAALGGGGFVVAWTSDNLIGTGQDGSGPGVYAQRYDATGVAQGAEFRVNTFTTGRQEKASVTALGGGGFVVAWSSRDQDGWGQGVYAQRYDAAGVAQGAEFRVHDVTANDQGEPSVTALGNGGFVVVWSSYDQDGSSFGVYAQRFDAAGDRVGVTRLTGDGAANTLRWSGSQAAWLEGAAGNDSLTGALAADLLDGGTGNDTLGAGDGIDTLYGGAGNDSLSGEGGDDVILGGDDNDTVHGGTGNDLIVGEAGNDSVLGGTGNDSIDGRDGSDTLRGEEEVDILFGDADADLVYGGTGSDVVMGERGGVSTFGGNDTLYGDLDANALDGGADTIDGDAGDDLIYGGGGGDIILGDNGDDTIEGGAGADIIGGSAASIASIETSGNDTFVYRALTDAGDSIFGFDIRIDDNDRIDLRPLLQSVGYTAGTARADGYVRVVASGADALVQVDLDGAANGANFTTLLTLVDRTAADVTDTFFLYSDAVSGTASGGADQIMGNTSANTLSGLGGNDTLLGREGNDTLSGGDGNDSILGEAGDDVILGGADDDRIFGGTGNDLIVGEAGNDSVLGGAGNDSIDGRDGNDTISGQDGVDIVFGDLGADSILGGAGNDVLMGERGGVSVTGGNDTIHGEDGDDLIDGDAGDDLIFGGNGNDVILGDNGNDTIEGGVGAEIIGGSAASLAGIETTGSDTFVYRAMTEAGDSIYGFDVRPGDNDLIDLRPLFDALGYGGTAPRVDGWLQVVQSGADALVQIDANGSTGGGSFSTILTLVDRTAADIGDGMFLFQ